MRILKFEKDASNRWYVVLPEWDGNREELEMVCGADMMLDIASQGESYAYLTIHDSEFKEATFTLSFDREESNGIWYKLKSDLHEFEVWLCHITKIVFNGTFPRVIFCTGINI